MALYTTGATYPAIQEAVNVLFGGDVGSGEMRLLSKEDVVTALDVLLRVGKQELAVTIYTVFGSPMPGAIPPFSNRGLSGMSINGDFCSLMGGINECTLIRYRQEQDGKWKEVAREDVRALAQIQTDNMGVIEIRKRTKPAKLMRLLRKIQEVLQEASLEQEVSITVG